MTPWELLACLDGHNRANGASEPMTVEEYDQIMRTACPDYQPDKE